ncbi:MAG: hypothetical protein ACI9SE_004557, partial [Neolewinella sp.]
KANTQIRGDWGKVSTQIRHNRMPLRQPEMGFLAGL